MAKKDLSDKEKLELLVAQVEYINEQMSQMHPSWAADMASLADKTLVEAGLAVATYNKAMAVVNEEVVKYKAKAKK